MLALNRYGGAEKVTKTSCITKNYVKCVIFMMLFVLMWKKNPTRCRGRNKFCHQDSSVYMQKMWKWTIYFYNRDMSLEDQRLLSSYLPMLREFLPGAAAEIESDMCAYLSKQGCDFYFVSLKIIIYVKRAICSLTTSFRFKFAFSLV